MKKGQTRKNFCIFFLAFLYGLILGSSIDFFKNASASTFLDDFTESTIKIRPNFEKKETLTKTQSIKLEQRSRQGDFKPKNAELASINNDQSNFQSTANILQIPSINLYQYVAPAIQNGRNLIVQSSNISVYNQNFLYGHNPGVFSALPYLKVGDLISYNGKNYQVYETVISELSHDKTQLFFNGKARNILRLSNENRDGLVLMTCYGPWSPALNTSAERFLVFAK